MSLHLAHEVAALGERIATPSERGHLVWRSWGSGEPLVLLHGGYGSWMHWVRNVVPLSRSMRVLAPDMPGFGESDDAAEAKSPITLADELRKGLDAIIGEETSFHITGFSFGGLIAGTFCSLVPKRIRSLTLVGSAGTGLTRAPTSDLTSTRGLPEEIAREAHRRNLGVSMLYNSESIDESAVSIQAENVRRARVKSRPMSRGGGLREILAAHPLPLAGIWGEQDAGARGFLDERREFLREFAPCCPFLVIEDAGHWVQYERAPAFNAALLEVLSTYGIGG